LKNSRPHILLRLLLLSFSIGGICYSVYIREQWLIILLAVFLAVQVFYLYLFYKRIRREVEEFAEATRYRDFSRNYDVTHAPAELEPLRKGFNEINSTFKTISREKETQYQYLQKVLAVIDTAIISFEKDSGAVNWMNDSFRKLLDIPYLRTIQTLEKKYPELYSSVISLGMHDNKVTIVHREKGTLKLLLNTITFQVDDTVYKLIAMQNINEVLDENEANAWQKLLSVMTHEIMNSIAPISSLADTLQHRIEGAASTGSDPLYDDLQLGIDTIKRRSEGLLRFAETYHSLNKITKLDAKPVPVSLLFENLYRLMEPTLLQRNIELDIILRDPGLILTADQGLVEQMLINMLMNAMEAVKETEKPRITLSAEEADDRKIVLKVADNGTGIPAEVTDKIFIPFYTTRKSGTGVGLSLSKQIMLMHRGTINVRSLEQKGTVFTMMFP
jgi:two-component system nitrogen regulation sensor histidine kinase NtrY